MLINIAIILLLGAIGAGMTIAADRKTCKQVQGFRYTKSFRTGKLHYTKGDV